MDEIKTIIQEAFGSSSSSEEENSDNDESQQQQQLERKLKLFGENPKWEQITEIKGLTLFTHFLSPLQQSSLLQSILQEGWFNDVSHNQAMRFGDLPAWASELSTCIREFIQYSDYDPESMDTSTCDMDKRTAYFHQSYCTGSLSLINSSSTRTSQVKLDTNGSMRSTANPVSKMGWPRN